MVRRRRSRLQRLTGPCEALSARRARHPDFVLFARWRPRFSTI